MREGAGRGKPRSAAPRAFASERSDDDEDGTDGKEAGEDEDFPHGAE